MESLKKRNTELTLEISSEKKKSKKVTEAKAATEEKTRVTFEEGKTTGVEEYKVSALFKEDFHSFDVFEKALDECSETCFQEGFTFLEVLTAKDIDVYAVTWEQLLAEGLELLDQED